MTRMHKLLSYVDWLIKLASCYLVDTMQLANWAIT